MAAKRVLAVAATVVLGLGVALAGCARGGSGGSSGRRLGGGSAGSGGSGGGGGQGAPVLVAEPFSTIARGDRSAIVAPGTSLSRTQAQWDALWAAHAGGAAPQVGFPATAVLSVFEGVWPTAGHGVEVVRVDRDDRTGDLYPLVRLQEPGTWRVLPQVVTSPFHMVAVAAPVQGARVVVRPQRLLDFETIDAGGQSAIGANDPTYAGELLVLRDPAALAAFWTRHSAAPLPTVDFASEMVVAVLAGYRAEFGNRVETLRILEDPAKHEIRLDHVVHPYRGGAAPPPVTETPYQILRVARADGALRAEVRSPLAVATVASGEDASWLGGPEVLVARTQAELDAIVAARFPQGALGVHPAVDFARDEVIFAFAGAQPSPGHSIAVAAVDLLEDGEIEVLAETTEPFSQPVAGPASPFAVATVPRTLGALSARFEDVTPRP